MVIVRRGGSRFRASRKRRVYKRKYSRIPRLNINGPDLPSSTRSVPDYLTCLADPFNPQSFGVRIPDSNVVPSVGFNTLDTFTLSSNGFGGVAALVIPNITYLGARGINTAAEAWGWGAVYATQSIGSTAAVADITGSYSAIRPVAHGVKMSAVQNITAISGTVHVAYGPMSSYNSTGWLAPTSVSQMQKLNGYKRYPLSSLSQSPLVLVNKPMDVTSQRYINPNDTQYDSSRGAFDFANNWCTCFIAVTGTTASVDVLTVQTLTHYEGIVATNVASSVLTPMATAEPYSPIVMSAASQQISQLPLARMGEDPQWDKLAVSAINAIEGAQAGFSAGGILGGLGGAITGISMGNFKMGAALTEYASKQKRAKLASGTTNLSAERALGY